MKKEPQEYYTPIQLKLPVDYEKIIEFEKQVYKYNEVMNHIDLKNTLYPFSTFFSHILLA